MRLNLCANDNHRNSTLGASQAVHSNLSPFQRFALRLREDYNAVKAGVTLSTNNGPVEGHINRLKMLKRQMYGRAGIGLLSRRFLSGREQQELKSAKNKSF